MTDPCVQPNCGAPREAPIHDDDSDLYEHRYRDEGAPVGYGDECEHGTPLDRHCEACAMERYEALGGRDAH